MSQIPIEIVQHNPDWPEQVQAEMQALLQALGGWAWAGGTVFALEHIGSTAVSGLMAKPCIDLAMTTVDFPLEPAQIEKIQQLGYEYRGENGIAGRQYFRKGLHQFHLHVFEGGDWRFDEHLLFREYLRANPVAREQYQDLKLELSRQFCDDRVGYTDGKTALVKELLAQAHGWHVEKTGFGPVEWVRKELEGCAVPWFIASGWALDLWNGKPSRLHQDFDLCVWRSDQQELLGYLQARGWNLQVSHDGKYRPWVPGEWLEYPEVTQVHARKVGMPFELLDVMLSEREGDTWWYRRFPQITMPVEEAVIEARGFRILNPAIILLFKSRTAGKDPRVKDQADFEQTLPNLTSEQKTWLKDAFAQWLPEHPWVSRL